MPIGRANFGVARVSDNNFVMGGYGDRGATFSDLIAIDLSGCDFADSSTLLERNREPLAPT